MAYHWRNGITFERQADGLVEMFVPFDEYEHSKGRRYHIPAVEWASIIAAVSADGENRDSYDRAVLYHMTKAE